MPMTPELISRIVGLLRKQGDRVILADSATGKTVVIMDLEQYEALSTPVESSVRPIERPIPQRAEPIHQAYEEPDPESRQEPRIEPRVEAPTFAPPIVRKIAPETPQKIAKNSDNPFKKRAKQLGVEAPLDPMDLADLTQTELLDKINRDIGDWKTAQERKRSDELQSVARRPQRFEAETAVVEEERFYLEPIE
jgi:hypothetical protein